MNDRPAPERECQAKPQADQMVCDRCALAWDAADPQVPTCRVLTYGRMRDAADAAASELEAAQSATVSAGLRRHRHQPSMARAQELRGVERLIRRIMASEDARRAIAATPDPLFTPPAGAPEGGYGFVRGPGVPDLKPEVD